MNGALRIGIDLGGSKIAAIGLAADDSVVAEERIATPRDYAAMIDALVALVGRIEARTGLEGSVGVGIPGSLSPRTGKVRNANSTWINGRRFGRDFEAALGRPIRVANDANCFALSEARDGAAHGSPSVFGVIIGTGCGAGIIVNDRLQIGAHAVAGDWGHNPLPWPTPEELPGPQCWCGKRGCLETWLSGPGMAADHERVNGEALTAAEIAERAGAGDAKAAATLHRYCDRLARGLASIVNILDPEAIVLGGGLSSIAALYRDVPPLMPDYVFSDYCDVRLLKPVHGPESGARGAARLWSA